MCVIYLIRQRLAASCRILLLTNLMLSQIVIPEAILIGNPDCNPMKSWLPDKVIRALQIEFASASNFIFRTRGYNVSTNSDPSGKPD